MEHRGQKIQRLLPSQLHIFKTMSLPNSFRQLLGLQPSTVSPSADGQSALLVIDTQNTYASGPLAIDQVETRQKAISSVVEKYRSAKAPIIWVQHTAGSGAPVFNPDNETFDFIGELRPNKGAENEHSIVKQAPSSFTGTSLQDMLKKTGSKQLVLTGYMASRVKLGSEGFAKLSTIACFLSFQLSDISFFLCPPFRLMYA